jgi:hypothetical protein
MSTGAPYSFFDDTRDNGTTTVGDQDRTTRHGRWMESVRGGTQNQGTEIAPGIYGDGNQKIVRSADGTLVIHNYGTINWNRKQDCGGVDYRDGNRSQDFREHIPYARDQRSNYPQTYSVGGDDDPNFGERQYAQWEQNFLQNMNQGNLNQRQFADRTYQQQLYGPQQPGWGPQGYYRPQQSFYPQQNFMPPAVQAIQSIAQMGLIYALARHGGIVNIGGNGGYGYGGNPNWYANGQNNPNWYANGQNNPNYWNANSQNNPNYWYANSQNNPNYWYANANNNGGYYSGGYVPGTFSNFQGGTQYANNAYAWQQATQASINYGGRPYANYPPGFYAGASYNPSSYAQNGWSSDYTYS